MFLILLVVTAIGCSGSRTLNPARCLQEAIGKKPYDIIIVPGFPSDTGSIHPLVLERVAWAHYLYDRGITRKVIFSGSSVYSPYVESVAMKIYAVQLGIRPDDVLVETRAEHTSENIYYSYVIARDLGYQKMAFATQVQQANPIKKLGDKLHIDMLPILNDSLPKLPAGLDTVDISQAFAPGFVSITERESLIKRLRGTMGYRVKAAMRKERKEKRRKRG